MFEAQSLKRKIQGNGGGKLLHLACFVFYCSFTTNAQDLNRARKTLEILASPYLHGRGYVQGGDSLAADYLAKQFRFIGLKQIQATYFQPFTMSANTFPRKMKVKMGGKKLVPGEDFIVGPANPSLKGTFWISREDSNGNIPVNSALPSAILRLNSKKPTVVNWSRLYLQKESKLTFSVAQKQQQFSTISILKDRFPEKAKKLKINVEARFIPRHAARNVLGYIEGTTKKDSFLLISAHYDHLGHMGKTTYFPGANDNASGIAMLLELAHYYSLPENQLLYSILFIGFAAEEAGLVGSKYFVEHPLVPLARIKFMLNLDLMGSGKEGLTVVNGSIFPQEFGRIDSLNKARQWFPKIVARGKAPNSDHYFFTEAGVPAFFMYTLGEITAYHDVDDTPAVVTFSKFKEAYQLITSFMEGFK